MTSVPIDPLTSHRLKTEVFRNSRRLAEAHFPIVPHLLRIASYPLGLTRISLQLPSQRI
jgi:hypothetical protein